MTWHSIRARLTLWYAALMLAALGSTAVTVWLLVGRSVVRAADERIASHRAGLEHFALGLEPTLTYDQEVEEYEESSDVSSGNALFDVVDADGRSLLHTASPDWPPGAALRGGDWRPAARVIGGEPFRAAGGPIVVRGRAIHAAIAVPIGPAAAALARVRRMLFWLVPLMTAVAAAFGFFMSGRALRPVDALTTAARLITVDRLGERLAVPAADDELRRLAVTMNAMLARLDAGVHNITRFTAEASHELRTPVTLVRTTAELALRRDRTTAEYQKALADIHLQAREMSALVEDLLATARADAGAAAESEDLAAVDLGEVAAAAADVAARGAPGASTIEVERAPGDLRTMGDARQLRRLIAILCDNAVKYSAPSGRVHVTVARSGAAVTVAVEDDGTGIPDAERSRVTERFFRGAAARASDVRGSGLGLSIAAGIVAGHRGRIEVMTPVRFARGTRVVVTLAAADARAAERAS